ncbi:MAG: leucine-rich repeat domain-containing protein, partial [Holosporales bacterium]|nr:leucine-rich repeat domain-containing protein [Holosporales bacterium]
MNKTQKMKNALLASCLLCLGVDYTDATQDRTQLQIHVDQQREYAVINDSQDLDTLINESRDSVYIPNGLYHFWVYGGNVSNIRFIKVEDGTKGIDCFYHWFKNLVGIVLPDSVTSIDKDAFSGCSYLNIRTLPKKLASIGSLAFFGCESLAIEELPGTLLSIGEAAFYKCKNLKKLTVKNDIGSIGTAAFCETGLT